MINNNCLKVSSTIVCKWLWKFTRLEVFLTSFINICSKCIFLWEAVYLGDNTKKEKGSFVEVKVFGVENRSRRELLLLSHIFGLNSYMNVPFHRIYFIKDRNEQKYTTKSMKSEVLKLALKRIKYVCKVWRNKGSFHG